MFFHQTQDKFNKTVQSEKTINLSKLFKSLKETSASRPSTSISQPRKSIRPASKIVKTQEGERQNLLTLGCSHKRSSSLHLSKRILPTSTHLTNRQNISLHMITNSCYKKINQSKFQNQVININFQGKTQSNPENNLYMKKRLKTCKKIKNKPLEKDAEVEVKVEGIKYT